MPGKTASVLVTVNAGVAAISLSGQLRHTAAVISRYSRVKPSAVAGSHPPEMNGAATLKTCCGERTMSNAFGTDDPPLSRLRTVLCLPSTVVICAALTSKALSSMRVVPPMYLTLVW